MKRIISLVLALSMILSVSAMAFAGTTLKDVVGTDYEAAVSALVELGIVNGYEDGTYRPEKVVTRAEMAKLLVIASGLEKAADIAKGATNFGDVPASHWATGYINVAAQYGYINGYPDSTFKPDETVTYAEAITMAIRVLGYKSVVESKGTWPTNYIQKAMELKILDGIEYKAQNSGATRGNIAKLIWNTLRTNMWDVNGENETNGLNYGKTNQTMIDKYFEDYDYIDEEAEQVVTGIEVKDGKVTVEIDNNEFELAEGLDFLNLFGRTVSYLYNSKDEKIVMIAPSTKDKVVEGFAYDLVDDDYEIDGPNFYWGTASEDEDSYIVGVIDSKKVTKANTVYTIDNSTIVKEIKTDKKDNTTIKSLDDSTWETLDEDAIVLIDGKWAKATDIKAGDVVSELVADELYIVSRDVVSGSFDEVAVEEDLEEVKYYVKVAGKEYDLLSKVDYVVEVDEDGEDVTETDLDDIMDSKKDDDDYKFYGERATLYLDFLGQVARIEFEEIEDPEEEGNFYVLTNKKASWTETNKKGEITYVELSSETYEVKDGLDVSGLEGKQGYIVFAKFDSKDRIKEITVIGSEDELVNDAVDGYTFSLETIAGDEDEVLDDKDYIGDIKVNSKTTVVTVEAVEDEDDENVIDHFEVSTSKGKAALKGVEAAIVAVKDDDKAVGSTAAYVFVWEDAKNTDKTIGLVEKIKYSKGIYTLTIDGKAYTVDEDLEVPEGIVGALIAFVEDDGEITKFAKVYRTAEFEAAGHIVKVDDRRFELEDGTEIDLDRVEDDYEDFRVIFANVEENDDGEYEFTDWDEISYSSIKVKKNDGIAITKPTDSIDVILIFRGYDFDA